MTGEVSTSLEDYFMSEQELQQQDAKLTALIQDVADEAFRAGEISVRGSGDEWDRAEDRVDAAVNALHEYIAELRAA